MRDNVEEGATIYTDQSRSYRGLENRESVNHSIGEYVRNQVHVNGLESLWAVLKRGYKGVSHYMSPKHMQRYVNELEYRNNIRGLDTLDQLTLMVKGLVGKRLTYKELIA